MYGTQTFKPSIKVTRWFENDVKMYGTQTVELAKGREKGFENDVKMYGTQTKIPTQQGFV